jgi:hypothetical protein
MATPEFHARVLRASCPNCRGRCADHVIHGIVEYVPRIVAVLRSGEEIAFDDLPVPDGVLRRRRFEEEPNSCVSVYSDHVRIGPGDAEDVIDSFRIARFAPGKLRQWATNTCLIDPRGGP